MTVLGELREHKDNELDKFIIALLPRALQQLDSCCDGAVTDDMVGFMAGHTYKGKQYAEFYREQKQFLPHMVEWIAHSLPYYFNTQLKWIDKRLFKQSILHWEEQSQLYEHDLAEDKEKLDKYLEENWLRLFLVIPVGEVPGKDRFFLGSLQKYHTEKGYLSDKQKHYAKKFALQYYTLTGEFQSNDTE